MVKENDLKTLLENPIIFKSVYELIEGEDAFGIGEIFKVPFTKIYQCFDLYRESKVIEAVCLILGKTFEEVLSLPSNKVIRLMKWLEKEIEKCLLLINSIPSVKDDDMTAAGVADLNQFGEFNIYYGITKDPTKWDEIGNMPFEVIFTKMKMDGVNSVIQHNYNEIIKKKK
ncbi:hypothetical protein PFY12_14450 [Chryseobacterium camelliae]|uniref:Uncharacterized protein n=1 Tax=Chryseobacterium camelliae TaxID=1265445 RepID=A0ABY7QKM2_9FLAO|nr:hypothetical protein [Chryseobacterium camelliae]WBV60225.1 hypothetical protein PFY12_14450 [Chryseobacterium camelliae]